MGTAVGAYNNMRARDGHDVIVGGHDGGILTSAQSNLEASWPDKKYTWYFVQVYVLIHSRSIHKKGSRTIHDGKTKCVVER